MDGAVLILRPQPGADRTAERARALGLHPIVAPLFSIRPVPWQAVDAAAYDAVMLTSANAARYAGSQLSAFCNLPCYAVGEATGAAANDAGFTDVRLGTADGIALLQDMERTGVRRAFHPCGADRAGLPEPSFPIDHVTVYAADAADGLPRQAEAALADGALVLLHSPRAARLFAVLCTVSRGGVAIVAISAATAAAAGHGWAAVAAASDPGDHALLELAAKLCNTGRSRGGRLDG